jgi:hypothetical protein
MNVKVITTCFRNGREIRVGEKHPFPAHQQDYPTAGSVLEMFKDVVAFELAQDAGTPTDIIVVNNDSEFIEGNEYIESLNGTKTKNGTIITYTRPNIGWSFGAYSDAFSKFKDDYDFWVFTEDDILVGGEDYMKRLVDRWEEVETAKVPIGFLALVGVIRHHYGIHCGGGVGFSSTRVLDKVFERKGCLPHFRSKDDPDMSLAANRQKVILEGEVAFTNSIDSLGFILLDYGENRSWNLTKNLCVPYYDYKHA